MASPTRWTLNLSKLQELVIDREAWGAWGHKKLDMTVRLNRTEDNGGMFSSILPSNMNTNHTTGYSFHFENSKPSHIPCLLNNFKSIFKNNCCFFK